MRTYEVTLVGVTPLLMHADNFEWEGMMKAWVADPVNKGKSVPGDDRTPAWRWIGSLYHDGSVCVMPSDNLMTMLRDGGTRVLVPGGKNGKTFKAQTQSGVMVEGLSWPVLTEKGIVPWPSVKALINDPDFDSHVAAAQRLGFSLFIKRAAIKQNKHIRVRPRFGTGWSIVGTLDVFDDAITTQVLQDILDHAGKYCGIGDWRPSSPKSPGPFGTFTAHIVEVSR